MFSVSGERYRTVRTMYMSRHTTAGATEQTVLMVLEFRSIKKAMANNRNTLRETSLGDFKGTPIPIILKHSFSFFAKNSAAEVEDSVKWHPIRDQILKNTATSGAKKKDAVGPGGEQKKKQQGAGDPPIHGSLDAVQVMAKKSLYHEVWGLWAIINCQCLSPHLESRTTSPLATKPLQYT